MISETNQQAEKLVGVEVSAAKLKAVCLDGTGNVADFYKVPLNPEIEISGQLIDFIGELKPRYGDFAKIGIAVPGLFDRASNRVRFSTHIPEQPEIDFADEIKAKTGVDAIIENDANAAAFGEYTLGAGRGSRDMFYVTLGAGVGSAIIFDGKIWRGASGFAGEFGFIPVNSDGLKIEEVASTRNIIRRIKNRFHQDSTSSLVKIVMVDEDAITISDVVRAANNGDDFAQMMLERTGSYVGMGVANIINLLNVERIVIGGEVLEAENLVLEAITQRAKEFSFAPCFEATRILKGELDGMAAAVGVALLSAEM